MGIISLDKEEEKEEIKEPRKANLIGFDGGKGDGDWLSAYPIGMEFLAENKKPQVGPDGRIMPRGFILQCFAIVWKGRRSVRLAMETPDGGAQQFPVNPTLFCESFKLYEIINPDILENEDGEAPQRSD